MVIVIRCEEVVCGGGAIVVDKLLVVGHEPHENSIRDINKPRGTKRPHARVIHGGRPEGRAPTQGRTEPEATKDKPTRLCPTPPPNPNARPKVVYMGRPPKPKKKERGGERKGERW